ncbi:MAG: ATP-dependent DNA helicase [Chloroflexi bacterium]|nr:ATP-dependent DNA helicase [Chloroflexota bacterium]
MPSKSTPKTEADQIHSVSVRNLVEFLLQEGDLSPGSFQKRGRAQAGTKGHKKVQRSRPEDYESEVEVTFQVAEEEPPMQIRGRIDGLYASQNPVIIEEIKTTTLALDLVSENHNPLHWAQAKCYAYIFAKQENLSEICIHLTYYQLDNQAEKTFEQNYTLPELEVFFKELITPYLIWFRKVRERRLQRNHTIQELDFPYGDYRPGQRDMAVAVYKAIRANDRLYAQAPTGVGKTIATLIPAIKAIGMGFAERIFYLTAKTPGRLVAEETLDDMRQTGLQFKSVTLTAKEKICFQPFVNCDPDECVFARNYFGKVKAALEEIDHHDAFTRPLIEQISRDHEVCPFEFSLDLALWVDCIICDYNYAFDPRVYLRRFFDFNKEPNIFLIDEAHNLPDRARSMYSAEFDKKTVLALRHILKGHLPALVKKLSVINNILLEKRKACQAEEQDALVEHELPEDLLKAIGKFVQKAENWLALNLPSEFRQDLLDFYFACNNYLRTAEYFDTFYVSYFERQGGSDLKAKLFCLDPAPMLADPLERSQSTIFFSATLLPLDYFKKLLTGPTEHPARAFRSPFPIENTRLIIHNRISTKYKERADSYAPIASAIETVCNAQAGNYLVFFPSYAYMNAVLELVKERLPEEQLLIQSRGMTETERESFLNQFSTDNSEKMIGFAVMGGIFGEGIDLVGERLIGTIVIGVGLPQMGLERDLIKGYFDEHNGSGFAYAYQYPGFNRVLQATGRVIRTERDRGIIVLIDERFTHTRYRRLFPTHWQGLQIVQSEDEIQDHLERFWTQS